VKGRTDKGAKRPVTGRARLLAVRCGVSWHHKRQTACIIMHSCDKCIWRV